MNLPETRIECYETKGGDPFYLLAGHVDPAEFAAEMLLFLASTLEPKEALEELYEVLLYMPLDHGYITRDIKKDWADHEFNLCKKNDKGAEAVTYVIY